ncbi:hypothetical protein V492_03099 [Pseudogymnoascus sp. VKM F-4246]|nr:hypothetical protein V492_03099 [Pseudogymnoascus sp. VKM F-4246]
MATGSYHAGSADVLYSCLEYGIIWRVKSGFYTMDELVYQTSLSIDSNDTTVAHNKAREIIIPHWEKQLLAQQSWSANERTVSDKLTQAFDSLERNHKILARMNFACCRTCAISELAGDCDEDETRGYVFFHEQITEGLVKGGNVDLYFGSFTRSERKNIDVGKRVVGSLRKAGLRVEWEGDPGQPIVVRCDEWRRRLQEDEDYGDGDYDDGEWEEEEDEEEWEEDEEDEGENDEIHMLYSFQSQ